MKKPKHSNSRAGFTLIELLVVVSILALLASVLLVSLNSARIKARNVQRLSNLKQLAKALELYADDNNGLYPSTCSTGKSTCSASQAGWYGPCEGGGFYADKDDPANGIESWIPGLTLKYVSVLPRDALTGKTNRNSNFVGCQSYNAYDACYHYRSNGKEYKITAMCLPEVPEGWDSTHPFYDPAEAGYSKDWAVFTAGAKMW